MRIKIVGVFSLSFFLVLLPMAFGQTPSAQEIIQKSHLAFYYPGDDGKAKVMMQLIDKGGKVRKREMSMLRKNEATGGQQKYFIYFHNPPDIGGTTFLVHKYPNKNDDRWIFIPAVNMVRRIAAKDSRSSFVGSDFSYEDVSGRDTGADNHRLVREEKLDDTEYYVIESIPKSPSDFTKKISWIDKKTFLPLKEEYYDVKNELVRQFTVDKIEQIATAGGGKTYPTATKRTMKNVKSGHRTEVTMTNISYDVGLGEGVFTERALQTPPRKWIQ